MKVGLVRHFKIKCSPPQKKWLSKDDIIEFINTNFDEWKSEASNVIFVSLWFVLRVLKCQFKKIGEKVKKSRIHYNGFITIIIHL